MKFQNYTKLKLTVKEIREVYPDFPMPMLLVFLEVCQDKDGLSVTQLVQRTGLSLSSTSRHAKALTDETDSRGKKGLGICDWRRNTADHRSRLLVLNNHGKALEAAIDKALT